MAGRIPDPFIDELLARTDIVDIVASRVQLKKTGKNYSGLCPFHNEKSPSFSVNPDKQFYYCFGCGAGGNAISFVMEHEHLDFVEAIEQLAKEAGLEVPREKNAPDRYEQNAALLKLLSDCSQHFQQQLTRHSQKEKATRYLAQERGLSGQIAKVFGVGFAPPGWDNLLKQYQDSPEQTRLLLQSGMLVEKSDQPGRYYDRFRDRIMFPIRDTRGRVIAFGGRAFGDEKPKYLNSPETAVFHKNQELYGLYEAKQNTPQLDQIMVVEGYMDVIVLAQHGLTNSVATLGTSINSNHLTKLFKLVNQVTLCFDGDKAGRSAAVRGLEAALPVMQDGKQIRFLFLPEGEDPDSLVRKEGKEAFEARLEDASSLAHMLFEQARANVTLRDEEGEAQFARNAMEHIQALPDIAYKSVLLKQLEELSGLSADTLRQTAPVAKSIGPREFSQLEPEYEHTPPPFQDANWNAPEAGHPFAKKKPFQWQKGKHKVADVPPLNQKRLNKVENATLCLLLHPSVACDIEVSDPILRQPDSHLQFFSKIWRFFQSNPDSNTGHLLGKWQNLPEYATLIELLNHPDANTKQKLIDAKQEVKDMVSTQERHLGLNAGIQRLKSKGNESIKNEESRQELRQLIEQIRKKK